MQLPGRLSWPEDLLRDALAAHSKREGAVGSGFAEPSGLRRVSLRFVDRV